MASGPISDAQPVPEEKALDLLRGLVSIPSPSGQEADAVEYLVGWLSGHGFEAAVDDAGSAVGVRGDGPRAVILLGHIDTVPGEIPVRRQGSALYGRGTVDAKGPLCAFAVAAASLPAPPGTRLIVIGATEEESATSRGAYHARSRYRPSACLVGEPSGWDRVTLGYRGRMTVEWSYTGPLAHSAAPDPSPPELAIQYWQSLDEYVSAFNRQRDGHFRRLQIAVNEINSGREGATGRARMQLSLRLPPDLTGAQVEREVRARCRTGEVEILGMEDAFVAGKGNQLIRSLLGAIRAEGGSPRFVHKTGSSDMNVVGPTWNCPIAAYGPGDSRLDHTPDEHIELDEYLRSIRILRRAMTGLLTRLAAPDASQGPTDGE